MLKTYGPLVDIMMGSTGNYVISKIDFKKF